MITLSKKLEDAIRAHGESTWPHECCGVLLGTLAAGGEKTVVELLPIGNAREDEARHNRFLITSDDLMRAELAARKKKLDVLGFYHSHPDHPARPSDFDREHALPFYSYIIVAVEKGRAMDFTSWELENDRSAFRPESVSVINV